MERPPQPNVVVLYTHSAYLIKGEPADLAAEQEVIGTAQAVASALEESGYRVALAPVYDDVESALAPYPPSEWVVFNLAEGMRGRLFEEARIAWALEAMGYRFTGSDGEATALSVNKARGRARLAAAGVPVPPGRLFRHPGEVTAQAVEGLPFPMIVKPMAEHASLGIGLRAVVVDEVELRERVRYVTERYRQAALVEAFIAGRELAIALWGEPPQMLPPAEADFSAFTDPHTRIVSFAAKWQPGTFEYCNMPFWCPAPIDDATVSQLNDTARSVWRAFGCRGYARMDVRMAEDGTLYVIDVNTNPDLAPDAGFFRSAQAAGYTYAGMISHILELALGEETGVDRQSARSGWDFHFGVDGQNRGL